jgi:hypothetical protein
MEIGSATTEPEEAIRLVADPISWPSNVLHFALESNRYDKALEHVVVEHLADYVLGALPLKSITHTSQIAVASHTLSSHPVHSQTRA